MGVYVSMNISMYVLMWMCDVSMYVLMWMDQCVCISVCIDVYVLMYGSFVCKCVSKCVCVLRDVVCGSICVTC